MYQCVSVCVWNRVGLGWQEKEGRREGENRKATQRRDPSGGMEGRARTAQE